MRAWVRRRLLLLSAVVLLASTAGARPAGLETVHCETVLEASAVSAGDLFGCALDAAGSLAVVGSVEDDGAGTDAGAVYVYRGGEAGGFRQVAHLTAAGVGPGDRLGFAVATDGERFVAGAPFHDAAARDSGGAWVFARGESGWAEEGRLTVGGFAGGLDGSDQLGYAVALDFPWAAVGAPGDDDRGDAAGAVYVFAYGNAGWQPFAKLTDDDGAVGDGFGASLSLSGDTLLVGAPYRDGPGREAGAVVVYRFSDGAWSAVQRLTGDGGGGSLFGHAVDVAGDRAAVGARGDDRDGPNAGTAYLYRRSGGAFVPEQRLTVLADGDGDRNGDELGISVALGADEDGELALVGARYDDEGAVDSGAVYLFRRNDGVWRATEKLKQGTPGAGDELGYAVALAGGRLLAGAYLDDDAGADAGLVCERITTTPPPPCPPPGQCPCTPTPECPCTRRCPAPGGDGDLGASLACPSTATPGRMLTWTARAGSLGPADSPAGARLTVTLPAGLRTAGAVCSAPLDCILSGRTFTATLPTLGAGASAFATVTASLVPGALGSLQPVATVSFPAIEDGPVDLVEGNDRAACTIAVAPRASYRLAHGEPVVSGDGEVTFPMVATNDGPSDARSVIVTTATATLPATPPASFTGSTCGASACNLGTLGAGESRALSFSYAVPRACGHDATTVTHTASVASVTTEAPPPPNPGADNSSTAAVQLTAPPTCQAGLGIAKEAPSTATAGSELSYTLTVTNDGPDGPALARVVDDVPGVLSAVTWTCSGGPGGVCPQPAQGTGDLDAEVLLAVGGVATFTIAGTLPQTFCGPLDNLATVTPGPGTTDPQPEDDTAFVGTLVLPDGGVCALKSIVTVKPVEEGSVTYEVLLLNGGPAVADAAGDEFSDPLPPQLALTGATASSGTVATAGNLLTWNGALPAGGAVTITASADVLANTLGQQVCNQGEWLVPPVVLTDDPTVSGSQDPTCFTVTTIVPALGPAGLALLALLLAAAGWLSLRRLG